MDELDHPSARVQKNFLSARWVLATALVLSPFAVGLYGVPWMAVGLALLALGLAALVPPRARSTPNTDHPARHAAPRASLWPDTGMKLLLEALPHAAIVTDGRGIVRFPNAIAIETFGNFKAGDPVSFRLRILEILAGLERVGRGETAERIRFSERVPTERHFEATVAPVRTTPTGEHRSNAEFVLIVIEDRTSFHQMERMRGDFIANASHELRTPLQSVTGFIETLLGPAKNDAVNRERFLLIMHDQAQRMARLIDDLLSLSRIEMRAHVRPNAIVDLRTIARNVSEALTPLGKEFGITIINETSETEALVRGDSDELLQVLSNLVENSIKYGNEGGTVRILLHDEPSSDGQPGVVLSVADNGPGIPAAHLPRLTERFYRVDVDRSRARKGTGLGLAIVKHIVTRHKGKLSVHSRQGEGAVFSIWFETVTDHP